MSCRLVGSVNFALHAELAKLGRHNDLIYALFNNDACVNSFPLFQVRRHNGQWKPNNSAHTCTDHNGNNVWCKFDFFTPTFCK